MKTSLAQITILNTLKKSDILTQPLTPPKTHIQYFEDHKMNAATQTPKHPTTFYQKTYFTKYLYFLRYRPISTSTPQIFSPSKFELFGLKNPEIWTSQNPSEHIIPNPNWTT